MFNPPFQKRIFFYQMNKNTNTILSKTEIEKSVLRISHEIVEKITIENLVIIGIRTRGEFIANRIVNNIKKFSKIDIPIGFLDVTFYRDDFQERMLQPQIKGSDIDFQLNNKIVLLVDDVLFTGRTIRAALNEIMDYGRPSAVSLAVLVDRGHREMPIKADFVGKNIPTSSSEHVLVRLNEVDKDESVYLVQH